ncbi:hypothetical protein DNTS_018251, partial [Danionella cerebrum]
VVYSVHVSDDYPDNTYVSNSENEDEVFVLRDPIPVIFHRIATERLISNDGSSGLSIKPKQQTEKLLDNYDWDRHKHPQLEADLAAVRDTYGQYALSLREYGAIDDVDIDLHVDVTFLDEEIALAWDVIRSEPVIVRLHCSFTQYLNGPVPTVDVFQMSSKDRFGLGHQLKKIMQTFVTQQWKCHSEDELICPQRKKLSEKKVKSPLHIFSTLRRSPSYPPSGCVKSKKKLKSEQGGVSKSHRLLRRTCSNTVKPETDGCVGKAHKLLKHSLSMEQHQGMKPPLNDQLVPCSSTIKMEDCTPLRPQRLSQNPNIPETPCEHASSSGGSHQVLGCSCSGSGRSEEPDGLKNHHRLLSRSCSSSTKMSKSDIFKEPLNECSRLSLTSGLIGILAPAPSSTSRPNAGAKSIPVRDKGFLVQPTVCERELCVFAFQTLGVMNDAADEIATGAQVVDLLVSMCRSALESPRKVIIFEPYPSVVDPNNSQALAFNPRIKDYNRVMRALNSITSIRKMTQAPYLEIKKQMDRLDPLAHPLLQWVISSNRSHIVKLPVARQLKFMLTPHQFLLLSSPPAKESNFIAAKELFGSTFAFHGSHIENWHSILRNGLVVASNTRLQVLHGAVYGSGIYLSPLSSISFGYSGMSRKRLKVASKDETAANKITVNVLPQKKGLNPVSAEFLQSRSLNCIALCEVITSPDLHKHGDIWVVPNPDHVCTRFFFVYEDGQTGNASINTQESGIQKEILRVIGNQTATG